MTTPAARASAAIERANDELVLLSHDLHAHPETAFEEHHATEVLTEALEVAGFDVQRSVCGLDTAFVATAGAGPVRIGVCAEYDALPDVGHACGHNVIAASALGAGIGLAAVADEVGATVVVLGTPAEEGGGGKILMLDGGAFDGLDVAMMVHPWPIGPPRGNVPRGRPLRRRLHRQARRTRPPRPGPA